VAQHPFEVIAHSAAVHFSGAFAPLLTNILQFPASESFVTVRDFEAKAKMSLFALGSGRGMNNNHEKI
jgi:hypothetical protein|tara:strand:- start:339 stop:542 length:204 start_codon:yes stop_codon:yes gene_type:complete